VGRTLADGVGFCRQFNPPDLVPQLDWRVLSFTAGVSILTGVVFGLAPALRGSDIGLTSSLKSGDGGLNGGSRLRSRRFTLGGALVAVQMALAIVVSSYSRPAGTNPHQSQHLNPGFETQNVLLFNVDPRLAGYKGPQIDNLYRDLQENSLPFPESLRQPTPGCHYLAER